MSSPDEHLREEGTADALSTGTPAGSPGASLLDEANRLRGALASMEHRCALLLDALPVATILTDGDERILDLNSKARALLPEEVVAGAQGQWAPGLFDTYGVALVGAPNGNEDANRRCCHVIRVEGTDMPPMAERASGEDGLAALRAAILNNLTHEVRTPLTGILGFTTMLRRGVQPEYQRFVDLIERSGRRLMLMLDTLLDLARLEAGTMEIVPVTVDLVEVVDSAVFQYGKQASEKGLELDVETRPTRIPARVDHRVLSRVLHNLLDNAVKFTERGRIQVTLRADDETVTLSIHDTGVGIEDVYLPSVFDEFTQESTGLERTYQGSGLGLAVSKRLIERIGGTITVTSVKGSGSEFTIRLPRRPPETTH